MPLNLGRMVFLLAVGVSLTACSGPTATPLSNALTAVRKGDRDAFLVAKAEAKEIMKTAKTAAQMKCEGPILTESRKRGEADLIDKLDRQSLFTKSDDERLVFALNVAGWGAYLPEDLDSPNGRQESRCPPADSNRRAAMNATAAENNSKDRALRKVLGDWIAAKKSEYGEDTFQSNMKSAANRMTSAGFSSRWPTTVILSDADLMKAPGIEAAGRAMAEKRR